MASSRSSKLFVARALEVQHLLLALVPVVVDAGLAAYPPHRTCVASLPSGELEEEVNVDGAYAQQARHAAVTQRPRKVKAAARRPALSLKRVRHAVAHKDVVEGWLRRCCSAP